MGMPGMTNDAVAAYAATVDGNQVKDNSMTVAEFRNKINPISHYYDNYDVDSFLLDGTISIKSKIEVLLGKMVACQFDISKLESTIKKIKEL